MIKTSKKVAQKSKIIYNKYIHIVPSYLNVLIIYQEEGDFHLLFFYRKQGNYILKYKKYRKIVKSCTLIFINCEIYVDY